MAVMPSTHSSRTSSLWRSPVLWAGYRAKATGSTPAPL